MYYEGGVVRLEKYILGTTVSKNASCLSSNACPCSVLHMIPGIE